MYFLFVDFSWYSVEKKKNFGKKNSVETFLLYTLLVQKDTQYVAIKKTAVSFFFPFVPKIQNVWK